MTTTTMKKTDHAAQPGTLLSVRIEFAGNGTGVIANFDYAPETKKGDCYPGWEPKQPSVFASLSEAIAAIETERSAMGGKK